jgi:GLPGLI family protein
LIFSCGSKYDGQSEGEIHYKVTYPKMDKDNFMRDFMPKKMTLKFKDDKYITNLSAGMGMFKTNFLCDLEKKEFIQMVKLINKKYVLKLENEEIAASINKLPKFNIEFSDETKEILGYVCKKATVTIDNGLNDAFTVFYTDEINIENPNWSNQFSIINGVLLEYQYEKYDVCMRFTAKKIHFKEIEDTAFEVPENYEEITEDKMDKEMRDIFESFN